MSGTDRSAFRAQVRAAFEAAPFFAGYTAAWAWSQTLDSKDLPIYAVAVPQERREPETHELARCELTLVVTLKIIGGENIEDGLDAAGDAAEAVVYAAIRTRYIQCELSSTGIKIDGSGGHRVGAIDLVFGITYRVDNSPPS
jgi:hypothetical protein